jgi:hypothetical protein
VQVAQVEGRFRFMLVSLVGKSLLRERNLLSMFDFALKLHSSCLRDVGNWKELHEAPEVWLWHAPRYSGKG